jgi:hypothetical protein
MLNYDLIMRICLFSYTDLLLERVDFSAFRYDWVINFPPQYINGWGFSSYDILMGHILQQAHEASLTYRKDKSS